jgi:hypothetical protein
MDLNKLTAYTSLYKFIQGDNTMKSFIKLTLLLLCFNAQAVDQTFSYQGELLAGGSPATGTYTIAIQAYDATSAGNTIGSLSTHTGVQVNNGLFAIDNVNLGTNTYDGLDIWLEIRVKSASDSGFTALSPRQKMKSVPYATTLIDKGATNGQVLTFDNTSGWQPSTPASGFSGNYNDLSNIPTFTGWDTNVSDDFSGNYNDLSNKPTIPAASVWLPNGAGIDYLSDVSIGTEVATHSLTILAEDDKALRLIGSQGGTVGYGAKLNFGDDDFAYIQEDDDDTLTIMAQRTAIIGGNVGIGTTNPSEQLMVTGNGRAFFGSQTPTSAATVGLLIDGINSAGASRLEAYDYTAGEGRTLVINSIGQGAVSIGSDSPASSAKLQVESTTQGFLPPRMSTAQRDAIASPVNGLTIYNTTTNCNEIYILNAYWDNLCDNMSAVVSGGGRIWLDRNLGAANVGDKGHLYQWGRGSDGHEQRDSGITATNATHAANISSPWFSQFITEANSPWDWLIPQVDTLWQGLNGMNNPCPSGFRVPSSAEWDTEILSWFASHSTGAWFSPLKLPVTGYRGSDGIIYQLYAGLYWSSTIASTSSRYMYFDSVLVAGTHSTDRVDGMAVRCIMD